MSSDGSSGAFFGGNGLSMLHPDARVGIFHWSKASNEISCVANDNDTAVPDLQPDWHFSGFGGVSVSQSGAVCFMAEAANDRVPAHVGIWCKGITTAGAAADAKAGSGSDLVTIVDSTMKIPGSPHPDAVFQYVDYPSVSPDGTTVVFQGNDGQGKRGVYATVLGGDIIKLFDWQGERAPPLTNVPPRWLRCSGHERLLTTFLAGLRFSHRRRCAPDKVDGQAVFNIQMNQGSFDGKTVSFWLDFKDENEGIFTINLGG